MFNQKQEKMKRYFKSEEELKKNIIEVVDLIHPYYKNSEMNKVNISIYDKSKFIDLQYDTIVIGVNYDTFGIIEFKKDCIQASGKRLGVGYVKSGIKEIKEAIEFLVKNYFL